MRKTAVVLCLNLLIGAMMGACSTTPGNPGSRIPDPETPGAQAFIARCGTCHALPHPKRHSYRDWEHLLPVMEQRMAERGFAGLSEEQRNAILTYLKVHGR